MLGWILFLDDQNIKDLVIKIILVKFKEEIAMSMLASFMTIGSNAGNIEQWLDLDFKGGLIILKTFLLKLKHQRI